MKKNHVFIILIALATLFLGCSKDKGTDIYKCKITGKVYVIIDEHTYVVQKADVTLTPENGKMQYFSTVKTDDTGTYQFNEAYKNIQYKLTVSAFLEGNISYYGETDYFTVSKDKLITNDIYLKEKGVIDFSWDKK